MQQEEWRQVKGFEGLYEVSSFGRVRSLDRERHAIKYGKPVVSKLKGGVMKLGESNRGYYHIILRKDGKAYTLRINRLVAEAFIPNPDNLPQVNHIDGDKKNNAVSNLEWCTCSHNIIHAMDTGLKPCRKKVRCIETGEVFVSVSEAARKKGVSQTMVSLICNHQRKSTHGLHFEFV